MSHNIEHYDYPEHVDKRIVDNNLNIHVKQATWAEGGGGLPSAIRWLDAVCESYEDAEEYIKAHDKGWYDQLAVKYKEYPTTKETQTQKELEERCIKLEDMRNEYIKEHSIKNRKSEFIGCPNCGSKIKVSFLRTEYCPVCKTDLRPKSTIDKIKKYDERIKAAYKQLDENRRKSAMKYKPKIRWLVKIEYHT